MVLEVLLFGAGPLLDAPAGRLPSEAELVQLIHGKVMRMPKKVDESSFFQVRDMAKFGGI